MSDPLFVITTDGVVATDGTTFALSQYTQTLTYNADGTVASITITHSNGHNYTQTFGNYSNGKPGTISAWVKSS